MPSELIAEKSEKSGTSAVAALYYTHQEAEEAVRELQTSGVDMRKLSIVGKDLWGAMFGSAFFLIPGIGPLLAAGPIVGWIAGALRSTLVVGGASALGAGLYRIGIPKDSIIEYETQVKAGKFVVIVHGPLEEVSTIQDAIAVTRHQGLKEYAGESDPALVRASHLGPGPLLGRA